MNTLLALIDTTSHFVLAAGSSASLADGIRNFIGPLLSLAIGIFAITFLVKREMTNFIIYLVVAICVCLLFYGPDLLTGLAKNVSDQTGNGGTWKG